MHIHLCCFLSWVCTVVLNFLSPLPTYVSQYDSSRVSSASSWLSGLASTSIGRSHPFRGSSTYLVGETGQVCEIDDSGETVGWGGRRDGDGARLERV